MILSTKRAPALWEAIALLQIQQSIENCSLHPSHLPQDLLIAANLSLDTPEPDKIIDLDGAYRAIDSSPMPYAQVLAGLNGLDPDPITNPVLTSIQPDETGGIVLCPFGIKQDVDLPISVWADIVRMLRTYDLPVTLIGDRDQRLDSAYFTEDATASNWSLSAKLKLLASAKLIVGLPNAYTWLATGWNKRQAVYYPNGVPNSRWFGFLGHGFSYILVGYNSHSVQVPLLVAGLRLAIVRL